MYPRYRWVPGECTHIVGTYKLHNILPLTSVRRQQYTQSIAWCYTNLSTCEKTTEITKDSKRTALVVNFEVFANFGARIVEDGVRRLEVARAVSVTRILDNCGAGGHVATIGGRCVRVAVRRRTSVAVVRSRDLDRLTKRADNGGRAVLAHKLLQRN